ncbi:MAG: hypothetical protein CM15mP17_16190 [Gammaproteobacteria bacterium]|nr:MAG: hypothetical protein CM15mP17_16190 [Gammaproteobacteria bacterium]
MNPVTIAVLDTRGVLVSSAMEDNSALIRPDIAFAKAWGCVGIGFSSRAIRDLMALSLNKLIFLMRPEPYLEIKIALSPGGIMIKQR